MQSLIFKMKITNDVKSLVEPMAVVHNKETLRVLSNCSKNDVRGNFPFISPHVTLVL